MIGFREMSRNLEQPKFLESAPQSAGVHSQNPCSTSISLDSASRMVKDPNQILTLMIVKRLEASVRLRCGTPYSPLH